jgi:hypothetical protein
MQLLVPENEWPSVLCDAISAVAEFMVRCCCWPPIPLTDGQVSFSVATEFTASKSKKVTSREECHWSHACKSFKQAGLGTNGILECKFMVIPNQLTEVE